MGIRKWEIRRRGIRGWEIINNKINEHLLPQIILETITRKRVNIDI
jgi:hypothetical protein